MSEVMTQQRKIKIPENCRYHGGKLSQRETEIRSQRIIVLLSNDMTTDEIAAELRISVNSVLAYLKRMRERAGVKTNEGLVAHFLIDDRRRTIEILNEAIRRLGGAI